MLEIDLDKCWMIDDAVDAVVVAVAAAAFESDVVAEDDCCFRGEDAKCWSALECCRTWDNDNDILN